MSREWDERADHSRAEHIIIDLQVECLHLRERVDRLEDELVARDHLIDELTDERQPNPTRRAPLTDTELNARLAAAGYIVVDGPGKGIELGGAHD